MKELTPIQNLIFRCGAVLFLIGLCLRLFDPFIGLIVYSVGAFGFALMQMLARYDGPSITIQRLRRQQVLSDFAFIFAGMSMYCQDYGVGPDWMSHNTWIMVVVIGCILQVYSAFRIPLEIDKEEKRNKRKSDSVTEDNKSGQKGNNNVNSLVLLIPFLSLFLASCASQQYNVEGTTNLTQLEGKTLYLRGYLNESMVTIDSCTVQHGRIHFSGALDSAQMCTISMEEEGVLPLVLENGIISLTLNDYKQNVTGSPMNDTLYNFIRLKTQLENEINQLTEQRYDIIAAGFGDVFSECQKINEKCENILLKNDKLVTSFILNNSDNILGPGVFMILTHNFPFPRFTPQIEDILNHAKPYFQNHPYVKRYVEEATKNQHRSRRR